MASLMEAVVQRAGTQSSGKDIHTAHNTTMYVPCALCPKSYVHVSRLSALYMPLHCCLAIYNPSIYTRSLVARAQLHLLWAPDGACRLLQHTTRPVHEGRQQLLLLTQLERDWLLARLQQLLAPGNAVHWHACCGLTRACKQQC